MDAQVLYIALLALLVVVVAVPVLRDNQDNTPINDDEDQQ